MALDLCIGRVSGPFYEGLSQTRRDSAELKPSKKCDKGPWNGPSKQIKIIYQVGTVEIFAEPLSYYEMWEDSKAVSVN